MKDRQVGTYSKQLRKKRIDKVTVSRLDMVLRMVGIQLSRELIDRIIDAVELIETKGGKTSLKDVCKMESEWTKSSI